ncbi:MAG: tautomerase family protein [Synergistaceae bacterium]|nr:tautomerase family protein [Synergistaceae bacterium]
MPVITVEAGQLTKEQKAELARELTASASRIMGVPEQAFIALIKENSPDNIGIGGVLLSERRKS